MNHEAAFYTGDKSFQLEHVEAPSLKSDEVQIKVAFCGICGTDLHVYLGHMDQRIGNHRVIGHEMSGVVGAVGDAVKDVKVGQSVVVRPLDHCGECPACTRGHQHICQKLKFLGLDTNGAFQQVWNVPSHTVHALPDGLSLKHAALIEPLSVAVHDVNRANLQPGEDVLVIGGGPIGMLIAAVAKQKGANVTVSEINQFRLDMAKKLGFETVNPKTDNVAEQLLANTDTKGIDVVFEVSGTQAGVDLMTEVVATRGKIVMVAIHATKPSIDLFQFFWKEIEMFGARVYEPADYDEAIEIIASGGIDADTLITDVRSLDQIQGAFAELAGNPMAMKTLISCNPELA